MKTIFCIFLIVSSLSGPALFSSALAEEAATQPQSYYTCSMHPEVHSNEPGECPICHMKLVKVSALPVKKEGERKIKFYRNPMNPAMTSPAPMKDNMGMDYIAVYEEVGSGVGGKVLSGVPGRASVRLDQTQFSLSGTKLVPVVKQNMEVLVPVAGRALSQSRVSLQISEYDIPQLRTGLKAELESPSTGGRKIYGKISSLDSILDPMTRSVRADVQLSEAVPGLRSESSITGSVRIEKPQALVIPESAVLYISNGAYVYLADPSQDLLIPRAVKLGLKSSEQVEVLEGLTEGDTISGGPNFLIDSESRIRASHD